MTSVLKAAAALLAASALALSPLSALAQEETTESVGGEFPAAATWAGLGVLGLVIIIAASDDDDSGPVATTP